jgi:hypothetical protein
MIVVAHEDRPRSQIGLKLLLASLARHSPGLPVCVTSPHDEAFHAWARRFPNVKMAYKPLRASLYNIKPTLLLRLLDEGHEEVAWIDADIIATNDIGARLRRVEKDTLLVAEDATYVRPHSSAARTTGWKLEVGRAIPPINSCVVRATRAHREILEAWEDALASEPYLEAQRRPWTERPVGFLTDQDVLEALLGSRAFAHVRLEYLERGPEILQYLGPTGYLVRERIHHLIHGDPLLVHGLSFKPWESPTEWPRVSVTEAYYERVFRDVSPYAFAAQAFAAEVGVPPSWSEMRTVPGKVMRRLSFGKTALHGLPQAALDGLVRGTKRWIWRTSRSESPG